MRRKIKPTTYLSVNHRRLTATQRVFPRRKKTRGKEQTVSFDLLGQAYCSDGGQNSPYWRRWRNPDLWKKEKVFFFYVNAHPALLNHNVWPPWMKKMPWTWVIIIIQNRKVRKIKIRSMETGKRDTRKERREKKTYAETNKREKKGRRKEKRRDKKTNKRHLKKNRYSA